MGDKAVMTKSSKTKAWLSESWDFLMENQRTILPAFVVMSLIPFPLVFIPLVGSVLSAMVSPFLSYGFYRMLTRASENPKVSGVFEVFKKKEAALQISILMIVAGIGSIIIGLLAYVRSTVVPTGGFYAMQLPLAVAIVFGCVIWVVAFVGLPYAIQFIALKEKKALPALASAYSLLGDNILPLIACALISWVILFILFIAGYSISMIFVWAAVHFSSELIKFVGFAFVGAVSITLMLYVGSFYTIFHYIVFRDLTSRVIELPDESVSLTE